MSALALTPEQAALVSRSTVVDRAVRTVLRRNMLPVDELRSVAHLALCSAAQRFDASKAVPFDGFAWVVVLRELGKAHRSELRHRKNRVFRLAREQGSGDVVELHDPEDAWTGADEPTRGCRDLSEPVAARMALGIASAAMASADEDHLVEVRHNRVLLAALREVLASLPEYERKLLELRYLGNMELEPLARALGVSLATVRRHHVAALAMVGKRMRARGFEGR